MSKFTREGSPLINIGSELPSEQNKPESHAVDGLITETLTEPLNSLEAGQIEHGSKRVDAFQRQQTEELTRELKAEPVKDTLAFSESAIAEARSRIDSLYGDERATQPLNISTDKIESRGTEPLPSLDQEKSAQNNAGAWGWLKSKFSRKQKVVEETQAYVPAPGQDQTTWLDSAKRLGMTTLDLNDGVKQSYVVHHGDPQAGWRTAAKKLGLSMLDLRPHEPVVAPKEHGSLNTEEIVVAPTREFTPAELNKMSTRTEELGFAPSPLVSEHTEVLPNARAYEGDTEALTEPVSVEQAGVGQEHRESTEPLHLDVGAFQRMTRPFLEVNTEPLPYVRGMDTTIIAPTPKREVEIAHEQGMAAMHVRQQERIAEGNSQYNLDLGNTHRPDLWSGENKAERFKGVVKYLYEHGVLGEGRGEYQFSTDMPFAEREKYEMLIAEARAELAAPENKPLSSSRPRVIRTRRGSRYPAIGAQKPIPISAKGARRLATAYAAGGVAAAARIVKAQNAGRR